MKKSFLFITMLFPLILQAQILGPEAFNSDILVHGTSAANTV